MLNKQLLNVKDLYVDVEDKEILHGVDLSIGEGETHVLMGPNGTGKSTLGYALMGNPRYTVKSGEIWFKGKNITAEPGNERAKDGIFLSFQNPLLEMHWNRKPARESNCGISRKILRRQWLFCRWIRLMRNVI